MMSPLGEREVQAALPPVEEGLYDLRADGVACQVVNSIEVISPRKDFFFQKGVALDTECV